ncbi:hypothetical protein AAVH_23413 [Aphelenchoides avenae]|nr:hypothetical protein AAVH_23413 [Aphelenchus avenae]
MTSTIRTTTDFSESTQAATEPPLPSGLAPDLLATLPLLYAIPSLIAYFVVFYVILRHFRSSTFYVLFFINGISEILLFLTGYLKYRAAAAPVFFPLYSLVPWVSFQTKFIFFLNYVVPLTARCTNFLMTLNRYTLVKCSAKVHQKIWDYCLPIGVAASFIIAIGLNMPIFFGNVWTVYPSIYWYAYTWQGDAEIEYRQSLYSMGSILILGTASCVLNVRMMLSLYKHQKEQRNKSQNKFSAQESVKEAEVKICIMTFIMFLTSIVAFVVQSIFFVYGIKALHLAMSNEMVTTCSRTQNFSEDLHIFTQPWMLIVMSRAIREKVFRVVSFLPAPSTHTPVAFITTSMNQNRRSSVFSNPITASSITHSFTSVRRTSHP